MNPIRAIFTAKLRFAGHALSGLRQESKLKTSVVSVAAVLLWLGAFWLFYKGFNFLKHFGLDPIQQGLAIGDIVMARMLSVFSLTLLIMLLFSNVLISFSTLYRSREVAFLVQAPVPFDTLFLVRFAECVVFSSWASAYLGSPLMLAYGLANHAPPAFYLAVAAFYLPYILVPAALGCLITLVLARVFSRIRIGPLVGIGLTLLVAFYFFARGKLNAARLSEDALLATLLDAAAQTQSPFLPSYWATHGVLAAAEYQFRESAFQFFLLLSNALLLVWLAAVSSRRLYYPGWSALAGLDRNRARPLGKGLLGRVEQVSTALRNPLRALVVKDIKLFWRDPTQWSQFVIFFGLMALYIANIRNNAGYSDERFWRTWIACLNMGACTLILSTLTSRFVFPLISLEGRRFWVLGLAPISFRQLVWQKFWMSIATTSAFTVGLTILSCVMLQSELLHFFLSVYTVCAANFGLAGLAVGLGSLYPNFREENPARIVSGMGGTLNFLLSIAYITTIVGAQAAMLQWQQIERWHLFGSRGNETFGWVLVSVLLFITALSVAATLVPMRLGLRNLENSEF